MSPSLACSPRPAAEPAASPRAPAPHASEAESVLRDIAFVLGLTTRVRRAMAGEKSVAA